MKDYRQILEVPLMQDVEKLHELGLINDLSDFMNEAVREKLEKITKKKNRARFKPPQPEEVFMHFTEQVKKKYPNISEEKAKSAIEFCKNEAEKFCNFYESKNWYVGKNKMKKWKASASNWIIKAIQYSINKTRSSYHKKSLPNEFKKTDFYKNL